MKGSVPSFAQLDPTESLHSRVTRALAPQLMHAERNAQLTGFPNEGDWCRQLGVSGSIPREAVKVLEDRGMAQVRPRSGTRARLRLDESLLDPDMLARQPELKSDPHFLRDLGEVRLAVEEVIRHQETAKNAPSSSRHNRKPHGIEIARSRPEP
jgi:DNA-binding FadR family transcriptional regulator